MYERIFLLTENVKWISLVSELEIWVHDSHCFIVIKSAEQIVVLSLSVSQVIISDFHTSLWKYVDEVLSLCPLTGDVER